MPRPSPGYPIASHLAVTLGLGLTKARQSSSLNDLRLLPHLRPRPWDPLPLPPNPHPLPFFLKGGAPKSGFHRNAKIARGMNPATPFPPSRVGAVQAEVL